MLNNSSFLACYLDSITLDVMVIADIVGVRSPLVQTDLSLFYLIQREINNFKEISLFSTRKYRLERSRKLTKSIDIFKASSNLESIIFYLLINYRSVVTEID
jgi:hypothetical protein